MSPAESALKDLYFNAQTNLNMMLAACPNDDKKTEIKLQLIKARHNWQAAENKSFHDLDPVLVDLVTKANATAAELKTIETHLGDIAKVIAVMTQAASYGSEILAKIITA